MFFDAHAHYDDKAFKEDRDEVILSLKDANISYVVNAGSCIRTSKAAVKLAEKYDFIYATAGVHPGNITNFGEASLEKLRKLCEHEKVVAVGEIGLDYHYDNTDKALQKEAFCAQLELAKEVGLPVVIHNRDSFADCLDIIKASPIRETGGLIHCFSGSVEFLKVILDMGLYISLGGTVTFKNANKLLEVAKYVPLDRLMLETDCPYLAPVPFRGKRNSSVYICHTAEKIAELKGISLEEVAFKTYENAKQFYDIK